MNKEKNKIISKETKVSFEKMIPKINYIDKEFDNFNNKNLIKPNFRKYVSPNNFTKTNYAYSSLIFADESYIPSLLVLGYSIKSNNNKFNLICMVQDKPTTVIINNEEKYFPGVSKNSIDNILKIYDVVYGIDLIQTDSYKFKEHFTDVFKHYKNISIYPTKLQSFGLIDYQRILFLDASLVINKNIDYLFDIYDDYTFLIDSFTDITGMGTRGSVFLIKPTLKLYNKALFLSKYYKQIFKNLFFSRGIDEMLIFFTVYPNWSKKLIKLWTSCIEKYLFKKCPIYHYQIYKPFKEFENKPNNEITFKLWDFYAKKLLHKYPEYNIYFQHIKNIRNVDY